jgi:acetyl esterase/lipase
VSPPGYAVDPELAPVLAEIAERTAGDPVAARGDWRTLREIVEANLRWLAEIERETMPDVDLRDFETASPDGAGIRLRWYARHRSSPGSAVLFVHGGGLIAGDLDVYDPMVTRYANVTGVPFLSVEYRRAPDVDATTPADDAFAALRWLLDQATALGVDPGRVAVMGESAGGGIAAGVTIRARDEGVQLARQMLIYPMLDDRNVTPDGACEGLLTWDYDMSFTCWTALLGDARGTEAVSPVAAPARLVDFRGLAPAYVEVGDLDIFRDEALAYAQRLAAARVPVEFHVHPGAPHGYERYTPESALARRAMYDRARVLRAI